MCGRFCCNYSLEDVPGLIARDCGIDDTVCVCQSSSSRDFFKPSFNICPSMYAPCLISSFHDIVKPDFCSCQKTRFRSVPMRFGSNIMRTSENGKNSKYCVINCRLESIQEKHFFKSALLKGQRCVILADGFYEWRQDIESNPKKVPYFVYKKSSASFFQDSDVPIEKLIFAGIFKVSDFSAKSNEYSFYIITMAADDKMTWLHSRMPAILSNKEEVCDFLDYGRVRAESALHLLESKSQELSWHQISNSVGDSKISHPSLIKPVKLNKRKATTQSSILKYFKTGR